MEKVIFLKYGELSTKKDNRNFFLRILHDNIKNVLDNVLITYDYGRMFIKPKDNEYSLVINKLKNIFGIHEIVLAYSTKDKSEDNINNCLLELLLKETFTTFKVELKRSDKSYPKDSMTLRKDFGSFILKNIPDKKVDIHHPDLTVNIEIRLNEVLIYFDSIKGLGGYPVSSLGKGVLMLSGGIDSPVSGYLTIKRGVKLEAIYFESPPHTSKQALDKVKNLAKKLALYNNNTIKLHIINFTEIQEEIYKNIPHEYLITIMRRMMYRISALIASKVHAKIIINGESIGQVASQTLTSMSVINEVVKIPVIRPVACFDKLEIISLAKKIGTYEISILPYEDCCTIFVPEHPVINPEKEKCTTYESLINYEDMIRRAIQNEKVVTISSSDELIYKDLL